MKASIGRKLFVNLALMLLALWIGVIFAVAWVIRYETNEVFDSSLQETAQRILPLAIMQLSPERKAVFLEPSEHDEYLSYQVVGIQGEILLRSGGAPKETYGVPLAKGFYNINNQVFYVESNHDKSMFVVIAESPGHRTSTLKDALMFLGLPLVVLIPFTGLLVWWSVRNAQRSITRLGGELSSRNSYDLHPISTTELPKELIALGASINSLMLRLKHALESERNFATNSAHELRTPIAAAMAQIDVLKADLIGEQLQRALDAKKMLSRLESMTVKLLQLARAEAGVALNLVAVDLVAVVRMVMHDYQFKETRPIRLISESSGVFIIGDIDAIGIVIQNLLENAYKYASPGTDIIIRIGVEGVLEITNDSVPVPKEMLGVIKERFGRADHSKSGSGIGLAIVETVVAQCYGKFEIESPCYPENRGFKAIVHFKKAPAPPK